MFDVKSPRCHGFLMTTVTILFAILAYYGGRQLHGWDQWWYVADTETLLNDGMTYAQHVFPVQVLQPEFTGRVHFMHNALGVHLVVPFAQLFGPVLGWVAMNVAAAVGAALITWWVVKRLIGPEAACFAFCLSLLCPAIFWTTTQPLLEASCTVFAAAAMACFVFAGKRYALWLALTVALAALTLCRVSYLPLLAATPVAFLWYTRSLQPQRLWQAGSLFAIAAVTVLSANQFFPHGMPTSLRAVLSNGAGVDGLDKMAFLFNFDHPLDWSGIGHKWLRSLQEQFPLNLTALHYWPFNVAVLTVVIGTVRGTSSPEHSRLNMMTLALLGIHLAQILLHQNQFRYLVPMYPVLLAASTVTLSHWLSTRDIPPLRWSPAPVTAVAGLILAACLGVDLVLTYAGMVQGENRSRDLEQLAGSILEHMPEKCTVLMEMAPPSDARLQMMEFALRPRRVAYIRSTYNPEQFRRMLKRLEPSFLIECDSTPLCKKLDQLDVEVIPMEFSWPDSMKEYSIYRLKPAGLPHLAKERSHQTGSRQ